jgi:signal transduction histidine kinase
MSRQGRFNAVVPGYSSNEPPAGLLDSRVSLQGVCGSDLNARRQLSGITIYVPNLSHIKTLEPAPPDPFNVPASPIATVATFDPERIAGRRVKLAGVVSLNLPGFGLFLLDDSGAIRVQTQLAQAVDLRPRDSVEVLGFPALGDFSPRLEEPVIRRLSSGPPLVSRVTTAEQILLHGTNDAALLCLDAELLQSVPRSAQPKLLLQQGPVIFTAQLAGGHFPDAVSNWRPGSLLRLTGVCLIQGNDTHNPQSFRLLLSGPDQVLLLKAPPAWSLRSYLLLAAALAISALIALSWIVALRRQVRVRTAELRASQLDLQRQVAHSRELSELGRRLNEAANSREAALIIADAADRLIGWDSCVCNMYSPEADLLTAVINIDLVDGSRCETQPKVSQVHPSALARRAIDSGAQLILRRPAELAHPDGIPFGDLARPSASILYVPIRKGPTIVGVLSTQSYSFDDYNEQDVAILQALADHCSGALDRIRAHQQLVEMSRLAGMAEVATGVLHNVGNVLNSVNVSVALLLDRSRDSHPARLARIAALLNDHTHDLPAFLSSDPKGQKIPAYLSQLSAIISADELTVRAELEGLASNVDHIKEIVSMQQSYARLAGVAENVTAVELVEDAIRLNAGTLSRHNVEVHRNFAPNLPPVSIDKHKVLQILINLIRNAKYACDESGRADKKLVVGIANGANRLRISVADNGVGIPRENLTRIFSLGFSTRKNGHGFGLHSGALAAKELGGSLTVQSDGPGSGAAFTLELPLSAKN